jgi:RimJ/RimL family protein N-acetyltransferase
MRFGRRAPVFPRQAVLAPRILARGDKTVLREFIRADVDRWLAWPRHRDLLFESYNPPLLTVRERDHYFHQRTHTEDTRQFSVDDLNSQLVGRISVREIDWSARVSVLGISFHPGRLNQGLGTDALRAFLNYYFVGMAMNALFLDVAAFNSRARAVYDKCGFVRSGQRWGEAMPDSAGVFRRPDLQPIRHLFHWEAGVMRPLIVDMVLRREDWLFRTERDAVAP